MINNVTKDIYYVGVNDHSIDLFEGQYVVPNGMAYNSYVVKDELITIFDTVDKRFFDEWISNIKEVLGDLKPNFLVVQHMEPDHSANIIKFLEVYPDTNVVANAKTFVMMEQFFHTEIKHKLVVDDMSTLNTGSHEFTFVFAPMVHWPEVMVTYDATDKVLFSADGFGKFGALDAKEDWIDESRRYFIGIVGKYGAQVQTLLKKAATLDIQIICPLHGPVLDNNLGYYINLYNIWSSYQTEEEGIAVFYTSVYGHTKEAAELLAKKLEENNAPKVVIHDLARDDMSVCVADAFKYGKLVLATTTYNASICPFMKEFLIHLAERNFQNKTIALIENGTWAPMAAKLMKDELAKCKNINYIEPTVKIMSSMNEKNIEEIDNVVNSLCSEYTARKQIEESKLDPTALFKIGYGLYVVTSNDGRKDNGLIVNSVTQVTNDPNRVAVCINKMNYSHDTIKATKKMNVNVLNTDCPFSIFEKYGFVSGRDTDKFANTSYDKSSNGLPVLSKYINAYYSLEVENYVDLGTHGMFICAVKESVTINNVETMTYNYYQQHVKPKPEAKKKGWVCKVCGYVYEEETLPEDFICPLCKHGSSDFEKL